MRKTLGAAAAAVFGIAVMGSAVPARAEFVTGNQLYRWCTGAATDYDRRTQDFLCLAYIQGAHDGLETGALHVTYQANLDEAYRIVCVPNRVEAGQLREIVVGHLRDKPEDRNLSAAILVYAALAKSYPCTAD